MLKRKHIIEAKALKDATHRTAGIYLHDQVPQLPWFYKHAARSSFLIMHLNKTWNSGIWAC